MTLTHIQLDSESH